MAEVDTYRYQCGVCVCVSRRAWCRVQDCLHWRRELDLTCLRMIALVSDEIKSQSPGEKRLFLLKRTDQNLRSFRWRTKPGSGDLACAFNVTVVASGLMGIPHRHDQLKVSSVIAEGQLPFEDLLSLT
jgi:hypothetical protein